MKSSFPNLHPIKLKGSGTFGYVYEIVDKDTGDHYAIKRTRKADLKIGREYQNLIQLQNCPRIVKMINVFYSEDKEKKIIQNIVMELLSKSLDSYIEDYRAKSSHIPIKFIKKIFKQFLEGLSYMHERNICHRDLKPNNIFIDQLHNVKIADFGCSKMLKEKNNKNITNNCLRYYRPPEIVFGHSDYSLEIDIFSSGCILAEMFLNFPLFYAKNEENVIFEQIAVLGFPKKKCRDFLFKHLDSDLKSDLNHFINVQPIDLLSLFSDYTGNENLVNAVDLMKKMLKWDPKKRISAKKALIHPFFNESSK